MDQHRTHNQPMIAVVMGVSGSGKTTVATLLAEKLRWQYQEGDALHPPENVEKMKSGTPLDDADRRPWLQRIAGKIDEWRSRGLSGVVTCSALKRSYRDIVIDARPGVRLVYLKGSPDLIRRRMASRRGHFMPSSLLDSQFATLEEPSPDENPIVVDIAAEPSQIVQEIIRQLQMAPFD
jgi:carbohydrate kinase (thermoresistant glucokinase family)